MNVSLEDVVAIIAIVSFGATVVNYIVIKPLRTSLDMLSTAVQELKKLLMEVEEEENALDKRVTVNETKIKNLTDRVDNLEGYHKQPMKG